MRRLILGIVGVAVMSCAAPMSITTTAPATPTQAACDPSPLMTTENGLTEVQGTMHTEGELWALLFFNQAWVDNELKIVWRVTGEGEFSVEARHQEGTLITVLGPIWGPEFHEGSNWERPGDEWGTGFNFPEPGCWTLMVKRGETIGEIRLKVLGS